MAPEIALDRQRPGAIRLREPRREEASRDRRGQSRAPRPRWARASASRATAVWRASRDQAADLRRRAQHGAHDRQRSSVPSARMPAQRRARHALMRRIGDHPEHREGQSVARRAPCGGDMGFHVDRHRAGAVEFAQLADRPDDRLVDAEDRRVHGVRPRLQERLRPARRRSATAPAVPITDDATTCAPARKRGSSPPAMPKLMMPLQPGSMAAAARLRP